MRNLTLTILIHPAEEGGFWATVPALPGCATQGESLRDLFHNLAEAIAGWLATSHKAAP